MKNIIPCIQLITLNVKIIITVIISNSENSHGKLVQCETGASEDGPSEAVANKKVVLFEHDNFENDFWYL